ncbi:MAG: hypothetical protein PHV06_07080, partial [bacterium]|nr:hypothetical protein [bacterium]
ISSLPVGWTAVLYESDGVTLLDDSDGDTNVDIENINRFGGEYPVKLRVYVPAGTAEGTTQVININAFTATSSDTVTDTIVVRTLVTYDSGAYNRIEYDFVIGDTIYAKSVNVSVASVYFDWYDNSGTPVYQSIDYGVVANTAKDQYTPVVGNQIGEWIVIMRNAANDAELNRVYINVGNTLDSGDKLKLFPAWSPEDNRVAYITENTAMAGDWHINYLNLSTLTETKLTDASDVASLVGINTAPAIIHYSRISWDPDSGATSGRIAFAGIDNDDGFNNSEIYTVDLTPDATGFPVKKVSPSGKYGDPFGGYGGWIDPSWDKTTFSASDTDGRWMAVSERGNIWVFKPDSLTDGPPYLGGNFKKLIRITNLTLSTDVDGLFNPVWFEDASGDIRIAVVYKTAGSSKSDIYIITEVDEIINQTLASPIYGNSPYDYTILVPSQYQVNNLSDMIKVTDSSNPVWAPAVSPDGTMISYSRDMNIMFNNTPFYNNPYTALEQTDFDVYKVETSTKPDIEPFFSHPWDEGFGDWSNNGQYLIHFEQPTDDDPSPGNQNTFNIERYYIVNSTVFGTNNGGFKRNSQKPIILKDLAYSSIEIPFNALDYPTYISISEPYGAKLQKDMRNKAVKAIFPQLGKKSGDLIYTGVARQFDPIGLNLNSDAVIKIHYLESELKFANKEKVNENLLILAYFDMNSKIWLPLESEVDTENNIVSARFHKLGIFGVFLKAPAIEYSLDNMIIYPNPFKISESQTKEITFDKLPPDINFFKIYNIAGDLVFEMKDEVDVPSTLYPGYWMRTWNLTNLKGKRVASGIYIVVIKTESGDDIVKKVGVVF